VILHANLLLIRTIDAVEAIAPRTWDRLNSSRADGADWRVALSALTITQHRLHFQLEFARGVRHNDTDPLAILFMRTQGTG